jgi:hypothetical protein
MARLPSAPRKENCMDFEYLETVHVEVMQDGSILIVGKNGSMRLDRGSLDNSSEFFVAMTARKK